jgi:hypothetical protein
MGYCRRMPFKLYQCFERVPFHGKEADRVIVTGSFDCPDGHNSEVLVEVRITAPPIAVSSWSGNTGAGFPSFDIAGSVVADFPAWAKHMCGQEITIQVRGFCTLSFTPWETFEKVVVGPRGDDFRRTWSRKVDGDMHVPPDEYQPAKRWYPGTLDELLWCVQNRHDKDGPVAEAHATASHWALSYASVTPGQMFETATPVHEGDGNQLAARLNNVLYDAFPECLTEQARGFFERIQHVHAFNPKMPVDETQNYLLHVEAGIRLHELYAYISTPSSVRRALAPGGARFCRREPIGPKSSPQGRSPWRPFTAADETHPRSGKPGVLRGRRLRDDSACATVGVCLLSAPAWDGTQRRSRERGLGGPSAGGCLPPSGYAAWPISGLTVGSLLQIAPTVNRPPGTRDLPTIAWP